jgi:hypothetical protein
MFSARGRTSIDSLPHIIIIIDMARNFKARPLPHIHRGASIVEPDSTIGGDDRHSAFSPRSFVSTSFFGSSREEGVGGGSPSSSSSRYCPSGAGATLTSPWRRKASSSRGADSECMSSQCQDNEEVFGRSTYMFEDGVGLLQRQREWADSRERRLEAARAVKAVEELAVRVSVLIFRINSSARQH